MTKTVPKEVRFLLAEDVRPEPGNKMTILGFFAGNDIIIDEKLPGKTIQSLTLVCSALDGEGTFAVKSTLTSPSDETKDVPLTFSEVVKLPRQPITLVVKWSPFLIPEFGEYTFKLYLDDVEYTHKFRALS